MKNKPSKVLSGFKAIEDFFLAGGIPGIILLFRPVMIMWISRGRDPAQYDVIDTSGLIQIIYTGLALVIGVVYYFNAPFFQYLVMRTPLKYFFFYSILAIISSIWSINPNVSLYRGVECLTWQLEILAVFYVLSKQKSIKEIIRWVILFSIYTIILSMYSKYQWMGLSLELLGSEQFNSTPYFFMALFLVPGFLQKSFILAASILSQSNTAYVGMATGILSLREGKAWMKLSMVVIIVAIVLATSFWGWETVLQNTIFYGKESVGMDQTSGRDKVIAKAIPIILQNPLYGYGFVAPEIQLVTERQVGIIGVHNCVLSSFLGMGITGFILLLLFFVTMLQVSKSKFFSVEQRAAFNGTVLIGFFHSIANPGLGSRMYGTWMPVVTLFTMICVCHVIARRNAILTYRNHMADSSKK